MDQSAVDWTNTSAVNEMWGSVQQTFYDHSVGGYMPYSFGRVGYYERREVVRYQITIN